MKPFLFRLGLFASPFIAAICAELFILPIDFFTFRAWEALRTEGTTITAGKYYPNSTLTKEEVGRTAHHTIYATPRTVTWTIDRHGYRKHNTDRKMEIVLVGDSFIAGDGLDQHEMLSEQLEQRLDMGVYPVAPANINDYINLPRFCDNPPSIVVLQKVENLTEHLRKIKVRPFKQTMWRMRQWLSEFSMIRFMDRTQNRLCKAIMLNYSKARIRDWMGLSTLNPESVKELNGKPFILSPPDGFLDSKTDYIQHVVNMLIQYKQELAKRGVRFIFMPVPNKETVYYRLLNLEKAPDFMDRLIAASRQAGIETIDLKQAFDAAVQADINRPLYLPDDSHWNEYGVQIAADLLTEQISKPVMAASPGGTPPPAP